MNKSRYFFRRSIILLFTVFSFVTLFVGDSNAASTIGTNITTTGTMHVGGTSAQTTFEVQGTASASYFLTGNTIQVGGYASVAYSRFGTSATGHSNYISTTNDLLVSGDFEVRGTASFGSVASVSGVLYLANGQVRPGVTNGTTAFRFQNAAGSTSVLTIDTTNGRVGIGTTPQTTFEVQGTASASYFLTVNSLQVASGLATKSYSRFGTGATGHSLTDVDDVLFTGLVEFDDKVFFDGTASAASDFEVVGNASASKQFVTTSLVVGNNTASSSTAYYAEFGGASTGTASFLFAPGNSSATGSCFQLKRTDGIWVYLRISAANAWTINALKCR